MPDVIAEAESLVQNFGQQLENLKTGFEVAITAMAWKLAAEIVAREMPPTVAVGTLSYKGQQNKKSYYVDVGNIPPKKAKGFLGKLKREFSSKVSIKGPSPTGKAAEFRELLSKGTGKWARRDGKVQYIVMEPSKLTGLNDNLPAFYKMKRTDNSGQVMRVKFTSMVSNWMYIP